MSNHHLRNKALSLKAKGLLSQMLSLPEDWDYTLKGPVPYQPGTASTRLGRRYGSLKRLDISVREQGRDAERQNAPIWIYTIYEQPQPVSE